MKNLPKAWKTLKKAEERAATRFFDQLSFHSNRNKKGQKTIIEPQNSVTYAFRSMGEYVSDITKNPLLSFAMIISVCFGLLWKKMTLSLLMTIITQVINFGRIKVSIMKVNGTGLSRLIQTGIIIHLFARTLKTLYLDFHGHQLFALSEIDS